MIMATYKRICITHRGLAKRPLIDQIRVVLAAKPDYIILREKDLPEAEYLSLAKDLLKLCEDSDSKLILHSFKNVAFELNYPHIHLPFQEFLALSEEERDFFQTVGVSTHSVEEALEAEKLSATYVTASHIFPTQCKEGLAPRGLSYLKEACEAVTIPVYALGGIHEDNIDLCINAGADGICMMSEYMHL